MRESYRLAKFNLQDLRKPSTISFYERYDAINVYRSQIDLYVRQCRFLEDMWDAIMKEEGQL